MSTIELTLISHDNDVQAGSLGRLVGYHPKMIGELGASTAVVVHRMVSLSTKGRTLDTGRLE